jgi:hypothetical protein
MSCQPTPSEGLLRLQWAPMDAEAPGCQSPGTPIITSPAPLATPFLLHPAPQPPVPSAGPSPPPQAANPSPGVTSRFLNCDNPSSAFCPVSSGVVAASYS